MSSIRAYIARDPDGTLKLFFHIRPHRGSKMTWIQRPYNRKDWIVLSDEPAFAKKLLSIDDPIEVIISLKRKKCTISIPA